MVPYPNGAPDLYPGTAGNYSIVCFDNQGQVLTQVGFNITFSMFAGLPTEFEATGFAFTMPYPSGTVKILITNQSKTVGQRIVSNNSPTVRVLYPNGGEIPRGLTEISWEANDLDGDKLTYAVMYSGDRGASWQPLVIDLLDTKYIWNTNSIHSEGYLVRVVASDGINTAMDESDSFFTIGGVPVGGTIMPIDKLGLLTLNISMLVAVVFAVIFTKTAMKRKHRF